MVQLLHRAIAFLGCTIAASAIFAAAPAEPLRAVDDRWKHIRSPNFELYTHNGDSESRELLHHLELLRAVFLERFKFVERARLDVTVYYFKRLEDFQAYASESVSKNSGFRGFYMPGSDRATISVAPIDNLEDAQPVIFHEYVHHLFRASESEPPAWFNEGTAELLASIRLSGDTLEIGHPLPGRLYDIQTARLLPLEALFAVDYDSPVFKSNDHTGTFYAESWALLHYWYFGDSGFSKDVVTRFTRVAGEQQNVRQVNLRDYFRQCFGMDYPEMQRRLERYVSSGRYRFGRQPVPVIPPAKTYVARNVSRDEARLRLAELALRANRSSMGKFVLLDALAHAPANAPKDPRLLEALGADAMLEGDTATGRERWEEALAAGSRNNAVVRELGLMESKAWFQQFDYDFRLPRDIAARLRTRIRRSIENEPEQSAPYEMLAWVEAFSDEPAIANVNLIQGHFDSLHEKARTVLALALVRVRARMPDEAMALLDQLDSLRPDPWTTHAAEIARSRLAGVVTSRPTPARDAEAKTVPEGAIKPRVKVPSIELPKKFSGEP